MRTINAQSSDSSAGRTVSQWAWQTTILDKGVACAESIQMHAGIAESQSVLNGGVNNHTNKILV